ncbi:efflux RND transporter periplasmic adaptor subunit [uncultured Rikenella sp.]|uniref:efflux RND transporter periplasmic adaptor subunit n=1 Tax=uncultured Rikenella sp. TaxID=368003 RepID=UPI002606D28A|nr:efflux RND transporter periplasmic adaptor subunit [uncultured Rikenella sp.]
MATLFLRCCSVVLSGLLLSSCGGTRDGQESGEILANKKAQVQNINLVDTITLRRGVFRSQLISNGKLRAQQKSDLQFSAAGPVVWLAGGNGTEVSAGAVIARVDEREAKIRLEQARQTMRKADIDLQDALLGFGYDAADSAQVPSQTMQIAKLRSGYDEAKTGLESARLAAENCVLTAPFGGRIANLKTKLHENPKGDFFCSVINDRSFDVEFNVLESELANMRVGQQVSVSTFVEPSKRYAGRITSINPTVDDQGQIMVTAYVPNPGGLIDGMNVKVYVESRVEGQLVVPKSAVLVRDGHSVLFRYDSQTGKAMWTYVRIEMSNSDSHAVEANKDRGAELNVGDAVIVSGNLNLADGSDVEIRPAE